MNKFFTFSESTVHESQLMEISKKKFDLGSDVAVLDRPLAKEVNAEKIRELSPEQKTEIKKETGWSDEIVNKIGSMKEYEIYKKAGLVEIETDGKKCLIRNDIVWDQKDNFGNTNRDRIAEGLSPLDKNGKPIQLHHIGQRADSPLAELTFEEHRCGGNDTILHDKAKETEVHQKGNSWDEERIDYWKANAENGRSQ